MGPLVIIDECVFSSKLVKALVKNKIKYKFLGSGKTDDEIERFMNYMPNTVLVTADVEFWTHFGWDRALLISTRDPVHESIRVIKSFINQI